MNTTTPITIAGNEYKVGFTLRAIDLFEKMTGRSIQEVEGTMDNVRYCYCTLKALNPEFSYTFEQFIDLLDEQPQLLLDLQAANNSDDNEPEPAEAKSAKKKSLLKIFFLLWMLSILLLVSPVLIPITFGFILIFGSLKALYRYIVKRGSKRASSSKP